MNFRKISQGLHNIYVLIFKGIFQYFSLKCIVLCPALLVCFVVLMHQFLLLLEFVRYCLHLPSLDLHKNFRIDKIKAAFQFATSGLGILIAALFINQMRKYWPRFSETSSTNCTTINNALLVISVIGANY